MNEDQIQTALRVAIRGGDGATIVDVLARVGLSSHRLQLAGIGMLIAVRENPTAAEPVVRELLEALAERSWAGDEELAAELRGAQGTGPTPLLKPVPVPLSELTYAMDTRDYGGRLNLQSGDVLPAGVFNYDAPEDLADEDFDDADRWLGIDPAGSRVGWNDMSDFIATVTDPGRSDRLSIAIEGSGAFRRFKDVLRRWPDEQARWYAFSEDRRLGRAREWLAGEGYRATVY